LPDEPFLSFYRKSCQALAQKIFRFRFSELCGFSSAIPRSSGGAYRDRHGRWVRDAMDGGALLDEQRRGGR
jgi:hypothetical protein